MCVEVEVDDLCLQYSIRRKDVHNMFEKVVE